LLSVGNQLTAGKISAINRTWHATRKHNPWVDFANIPSALNLPLSALPADLTALPTVAVLVPNLCNDMHDCPVASGDTWAQHHLPSYLPMVHPGDVAGRIDHYAILRTMEDMYGLAPLAEAANTPPITGIWAPGR
jgi:phosphatidylinositol-3-phosphatase